MKSILILLAVLLAGTVRAISYTVPTLNTKCLDCINAGHDICSRAPFGSVIDPTNAICCASMKNQTDVCQKDFAACTWKTSTKNKYSKFFNCRANSQCKVQGGISGFTIYSMNTAKQTMLMNKVQDIGPCKYVLLNSMKQKGYIQLYTDEP